MRAGEGKRQGGRPRVRLGVQGVQTTALIDSGSVCTLIDRDLYNQLPHLTILYSAPRLVSISGHALNAFGVTYINIGGIHSRVVVVDHLSPQILLGADFLQNCIIDFQGKAITVGDQKFPMDISPENVASSCGISNFMPKAPSEVIQKVLDNFRDIFSTKENPVKVATSLPAVRIENEGPPIRQRPYRVPLAKRKQVEESIGEMPRDGIIRQSNSPWSSSVVLIPKKDGSIHTCIDYRQINMRTKKDAFPLPSISEISVCLKKHHLFKLRTPILHYM